MKQKRIQSLLTGPAQTMKVEVRREVSSTNTLLKQAAAEGAPEGTVLIACRQTAGKGRLGRSFYSPEETGLYMSVLLRPELKVQDSLLITTAAAVAAAEAIEKTTGVKAEIKWVNDIYCRRKKTAGILTEGSIRPGSDQLAYAVLGIGINVWKPKNDFPAEIQSIAGSILEESCFDEDLRNRLAAAILNEFMRLYPKLSEIQFMDAYRQRSFLLGLEVCLM